MRILAIVIVLLTSISLFGETERIKDFDQLMDCLKSGKTVKAVMNYGESKLIANNEEKTAPKAIGGITVDAWEFFDTMSIGNKKAFVVFSAAKLINYGGFIYNYAKFKIDVDNNVILTAQYANGKTLEVEMNEKFFTTVNDGENDGQCSLFYEK